MKKTINNKVKPAYVVDITNCDDLYDVALAFATAKQKAGQPLSDDNIDIICENAIDKFTEVLDEAGIITKKNKLIEPVSCTICICETKPKKLPWYKKLWNALKSMFTR